MFRTYSVIQGIDQFLPVDLFIPGCPPRPESIFVAWLAIKEKMDKKYTPTLVNFGKDVSPTPIIEGYDSDICFDPLRSNNMEFLKKKKRFYGD
ncbi:NAD(P)H-quinone oxidoreductase subunit K, chloroplastic [bioreactor metagenome]|uniref:NAD(P)H-quinone oxidoreductase subunit K, chloroplastic n=1 Tax=bioreactor metagenome TaxID=1076179 RepID=A0A645I1F5_9ZZZZ